MWKEERGEAAGDGEDVKVDIEGAWEWLEQRSSGRCTRRNAVESPSLSLRCCGASFGARGARRALVWVESGRAAHVPHAVKRASKLERNESLFGRRAESVGCVGSVGCVQAGETTRRRGCSTWLPQTSARSGRTPIAPADSSVMHFVPKRKVPHIKVTSISLACVSQNTNDATK